MVIQIVLVDGELILASPKVQIGEYTEEVTAWTEITLDLPNPSSDYYVGFQATSGYGYGVTLDDVCVQAALSTNDNELLDIVVIIGLLQYLIRYIH